MDGVDAIVSGRERNGLGEWNRGACLDWGSCRAPLSRMIDALMWVVAEDSVTSSMLDTPDPNPYQFPPLHSSQKLSGDGPARG